MSVQHLNRRIDACSKAMDCQRHDLLVLLRQQRQSVRQQLAGAPLPVIFPVALGVALVSGFLMERLFHYPSSSQLIRLAIALRGF
ncbi:hypothetical protein Maes01_00714 [Microbulbifer aestuariivivens]|uniref:Uncharacterized protein n=1 Tax=Microbulbifer aestuariivivens TaxID=1908308 RepID=A0ABP9WM36_9GAMM